MPTPKIVNVASVPQRSPFRYPGGKTWLVPHLRAWLRSLPTKPKLLVEPFLGGGIVSLTAGFEGLVDHVLMAELDAQVAAVWQAVLGKDAVWLAERIMAFEVTSDSVKAELARPARSLRQRAFQTILKNRVYHGGILAAGSRPIRRGENGKGIASRWYPATLRKRILAIAALKERFTFVEGDGLAALQRHAGDAGAVFFIDPPYTAAGKRAGSRLYTHNELDHERLFALAAGLTGDFLMTYDAADGVRALARRHGLDTALVAMKNTHHAEMTELLIGRDLGWVRRASRPAERPPLLFE